MTQNLDVTRILSLGTIGLGFLLAFLAFRLLTQEQSKDRPREGILRATNRFMIFSLALCVIGLSSELYRASRPAPAPSQQPTMPQGPGFFTLDSSEQAGAIQAAETFLHKLDGGDIRGSYDILSMQVQTTFTFDNFKSQMGMMRQAVGSFKERRFDTALKGLGPGLNGSPQLFYYLNFRSVYEHSTLSCDTLTLVKDDTGRFKVVGINVR